MTKTEVPWWNHEFHTDRRPLLLARNAIAAAIRDYFAQEGFVEIDPAILQVSPGNETHIHGLETAVRRPDGTVLARYLHTSPEFAMKKLLAAGERRIFSFGHVFRNREQGALHAAEFTMIEWYRAEEPYESVMGDCVNLLRIAARAAGSLWFSWRGISVDPSSEPERLTVHEAFRIHANIDLMASLHSDGAVDSTVLAAAALSSGVVCAENDTWSDIFSRLLVAKVEPNLGKERVTILDRYPAPEAALARNCSDEKRVAERFEVYACGVELANGFGELTDARQQRKRFEHEMSEKQRVYQTRYPLDEDFLSALQNMPEASGCALGFDRLVMLVTGASRINQVVWTPFS